MPSAPQWLSLSRLAYPPAISRRPPCRYPSFTSIETIRIGVVLLMAELHRFSDYDYDNDNDNDNDKDCMLLK
jgi:hypothetical protein